MRKTNTRVPARENGGSPKRLSLTVLAVWCLLSWTGGLAGAQDEAMAAKLDELIRSAAMVAQAPPSAPPTSQTAVSGEAPRDEYADLAASLLVEEEDEKEIFTYRCKYAPCAIVKKVLSDFVTASGSVSGNPAADIVVVSDVSSNIPVLRRIAEAVDQRVPQVRVEAQIVEILLDTDYEKEVRLALTYFKGDSVIESLIADLATPGAEPSKDQGGALSLRPWVHSYTGGADALSVFLHYLETRNKAKILSAPNLILRQGSEGSIVTGEEVPIQEQTVVSGSVSTSTKFKSVGVKLLVAPLMISNGRVHLSVAPEVSTITGYTQASETTAANPIIAVRKAQTELEILDGELISIGGLLRNEERQIQRRVPILSSIPVLGHFFRSTRKQTIRTQLVIFLRIEILDEGSPGGVRIYRPKDIPKETREEFERMEQDMQFPPTSVKRDWDELTRDKIE